MAIFKHHFVSAVTTHFYPKA